MPTIVFGFLFGFFSPLQFTFSLVRILTVSSISLLSSVYCLQTIFRQRWLKVSCNGPQLAIRRWIKLKDNKKTYEKNSERSFFGKKARAKRWLQTDVVVSVFLCAKKFRKVFQNSVQKVNSALSLVNFDAKKIKSNSAKLSTQSSAKFCAKFFGKDWVLK